MQCRQASIELEKTKFPFPCLDGEGGGDILLA